MEADQILYKRFTTDLKVMLSEALLQHFIPCVSNVLQICKYICSRISKRSANSMPEDGNEFIAFFKSSFVWIHNDNNFQLQSNGFDPAFSSEGGHLTIQPLSHKTNLCVVDFIGFTEFQKALLDEQKLYCINCNVSMGPMDQCRELLISRVNCCFIQGFHQLLRTKTTLNAVS